jgi:hypothetical protein
VCLWLRSEIYRLDETQDSSQTRPASCDILVCPTQQCPLPSQATHQSSWPPHSSDQCSFKLQSRRLSRDSHHNHDRCLLTARLSDLTHATHQCQWLSQATRHCPLPSDATRCGRCSVASRRLREDKMFIASHRGTGPALSGHHLTAIFPPSFPSSRSSARLLQVCRQSVALI